ncbi:class I SAM-dependent methyltransferase [Chloroflexota bacterium]
MTHFDEIAEEYMEQVPEHIRLHYLKKKTRLIECILQGLNNKDKLVGLDLGCGLGWYSQKLSIEGYGNIIGLDFSENEIRIAKATYNHLCFMVGTAKYLPFKNESLDFVYSINMFHHLSAKIQKIAFYEIERVLKPDGYFFLQEINMRNPLFRLYMRYIFPNIKKIDTGDEEWVSTKKLNELNGLELTKIDYFTFMPDFTPKYVFPIFKKIECALEKTALRKYGIHYMATLKKLQGLRNRL